MDGRKKESGDYGFFFPFLKVSVLCGCKFFHIEVKVDIAIFDREFSNTIFENSINENKYFFG